MARRTTHQVDKRRQLKELLKLRAHTSYVTSYARTRHSRTLTCTCGTGSATFCCSAACGNTGALAE
jgi:hypothetical protein